MKAIINTLKQVLPGLISCALIHAQSVGIGTVTPHPSAQLEIFSTSQGLLIPRMTTAQRNAIVNPAHSLLIFNMDNFCIEAYDSASGQWLAVSCPAACNPCDSCPLPVIDSLTGPTSVCAGDTLVFKLWSPTGGAYIWNVDSSWTILSTGQYGIFIAGQPATVYGYLCNECGCVGDSLTVHLGTAPALTGITQNPASPVCPADTILLKATATGAVTSWTWTVPTGWTVIGPTNLDSLLVQGSPGATATIWAKACNGCGCDSASISVQVQNATLSVSITGPTFACAGDTVVWRASVPGATSWTWSYPPSWTLIAQGGDSIVLQPDTTNGQLIVQVSDGCAVGTDTLTVSADSCRFLCSFVEIVDSTDTVTLVYPNFIKRLTNGNLLIGGVLKVGTSPYVWKGFLTLMSPSGTPLWTKIIYNDTGLYIFDAIELANGNILISGGFSRRGYLATLNSAGTILTEKYFPYSAHSDAIVSLTRIGNSVYAVQGTNNRFGWGPEISRIIKINPNNLNITQSTGLSSTGVIPGCEHFSPFYLDAYSNKLFIAGMCGYRFSSISYDFDLKLIIFAIDTTWNISVIKRYDNTTIANDREPRPGRIKIDSFRGYIVVPVFEYWASGTANNKNVLMILDTSLNTVFSYDMDGPGRYYAELAEGDVYITRTGYLVARRKAGTTPPTLSITYLDSALNSTIFSKLIQLPISINNAVKIAHISPNRFLIVAGSSSGLVLIPIDSSGNIVNVNNSCSCISSTPGPLPSPFSIPSAPVSYSITGGLPIGNNVNYIRSTASSRTGLCP